MTTGERIKLQRKKLSMSAEQLAEKVNLSPATIYRYEKGDIEKVPADILKKIARALNSSPAYLMGWEPDSKPPSPPVPAAAEAGPHPACGQIACGTPILAERMSRPTMKSPAYGVPTLRCCARATAWSKNQRRRCRSHSQPADGRERRGRCRPDRWRGHPQARVSVR